MLFEFGVIAPDLVVVNHYHRRAVLPRDGLKLFRRHEFGFKPPSPLSSFLSSLKRKDTINAESPLIAISSFLSIPSVMYSVHWRPISLLTLF
jgi:hypothetical protein